MLGSPFFHLLANPDKLLTVEICLLWKLCDKIDLAFIKQAFLQITCLKKCQLTSSIFAFRWHIVFI